MKNIELKIVCDNFGAIKNLLKIAKARFAGTLNQTDTYFKCKNGRLKLREINKRYFELISYQRPDKKTSKLSDYQVIKLKKDEAEDMKRVLKKSLGEKVVVKKKRDLWIYENTRIHLDFVEKLGNFLELETVLQIGDLEHFKNEHAKVIELLGIENCKKIRGSYSDLLLAK